MAKTRKKNGSPPLARRYRHPESANALRPDVGTQAYFKKNKPPKNYRYDSSLSPALDRNGQNHGREQGEALLRQILPKVNFAYLCQVVT